MIPDPVSVRFAGRPAAAGGRRLPLSYLGLGPFAALVGVFLLLPTALVAAGALTSPGGLADLARPYIVRSFVNSVILSICSAATGAVGGAILAYAVATGPRDGLVRKVVSSACGMLAQFGGVALAFAFIACLGGAGFITVWLQGHGLDIYAGGVWLYRLPGLVLVYTYFQVPLMVLVFLPALDGIRPQWREATASLGGGAWHYWRHVAGPLLLPAFSGAALLLFANAFSAYATAAALISQGGIIAPLQISNALTSEVGLAQEGLAKTLALAMVVVVALAMGAYSLLQRRSARWLR